MRDTSPLLSWVPSYNLDLYRLRVWTALYGGPVAADPQDLLLPAPGAGGSRAPPPGNGQAAAPERDPEWLRFEADVRAARTALKRVALAAIAAGEQPNRITVLSVCREAGRSRSQLYASHPRLLPLITAAQAAAERLMERRAERARVAAARPGRTALEEENRRLRGAVKLLEGRNASRYASEMYALVFDRDGQLPQVRIAQLEATVVRKNAEIEKLRGFLAAYSALVPFQPARGSIIEGSAS